MRRRGVLRRDLDPDAGYMCALVVCLWAYVAVRSVNLAFTADESISFFNLRTGVRWTSTANTHWLNSALMWVAYQLFGGTEWMLRLPNVLIFGLYGAAAIALARSANARAVKWLIFAGLLGDPFLLEFFGLARGYGLGVAFSTASLACLLAWPPRRPQDVVRWVSVLLATTTLAFYANFATVTVGLAEIVTAGVLLMFRRRGGELLTAQMLRRLGLVLAVFAVLWVPGLLALRQLRDVGALYYGGHTGFVHDTLGTIVQNWGYAYSYSHTTIPLPGWAEAGSGLVVTLIVLAFAYVAYSSNRSGRFDALRASAFVVALMILFVELGARIGGSLYPIDRTALTCVAPLVVFLGLALDDALSHWDGPAVRHRVAGGVAILIALGAVNLASHVNTAKTLIWPFDAPDKAIVGDLLALRKREHDRGVRLTMKVPTDVGLGLVDYYQQRLESRGVTITEGHVQRPGADVYEVPASDSRLVAYRTRLWRTFPGTGVELWVADSLRARPPPKAGARPG